MSPEECHTPHHGGGKPGTQTPPTNQTKETKHDERALAGSTMSTGIKEQPKEILLKQVDVLPRGAHQKVQKHFVPRLNGAGTRT